MKFFKSFKEVWFPCKHKDTYLMESEDKEWRIKCCTNCNYEEVIKRPPPITRKFKVIDINNILEKENE